MSAINNILVGVCDFTALQVAVPQVQWQQVLRRAGLEWQAPEPVP